MSSSGSDSEQEPTVTLDDVVRRNRKLVTRNGELISDNEELLEENNRLREKIDDLNAQIEELKGMLDEGKEQLNSVAETFSEVMKEVIVKQSCKKRKFPMNEWMNFMQVFFLVSGSLLAFSLSL